MPRPRGHAPGFSECPGVNDPDASGVVFRRGRGILGSGIFPPVHLYLHVPFCQRRCSYCDFSIAVRKSIPAREYVAAIRSEIARQDPVFPTPGASPGKRESEDTPTIYLGGGTPSLLPPEAIAGLLTALHHAFPARISPTRFASLAQFEVTLEANPEDVTPKAAAEWRRAGINRISLGSQSFDDRVLKWMHRVHDAARITLAMKTLRAAGFDNISLDLIFALPAELERDWHKDLVNAMALEPDHLSLYGLTVEERTPLARWVSRGASGAPDDDRYADEYLLAHERLAVAGYEFYEVSNAARSGGARISQHNSAYWTGRPYRGLARRPTALTAPGGSGTAAPGRTIEKRSRRGRAPSNPKRCSLPSNNNSSAHISTCGPAAGCRQRSCRQTGGRPGSMRAGQLRLMGGSA